MPETGLKVLCSRPELIVIQLPDRSIVKVSIRQTRNADNAVIGIHSPTVSFSEGSGRHRETVTVRGGEIFVSRGGMGRPKKFDIGDLLRMNRALRLFKRGGDAAVLVHAAKKVLSMEE